MFDKTGTLTQGKFGVTDIVSLSSEYNENEILKYASSLESYSEHPIAKGDVNSAKETFNVEDFKSIPGKGVQGKVDGKSVEVVSPGFLKERNIPISSDEINQISSEGKRLFLIIDDELKGAVALADINKRRIQKSD